MIWWFIAGMITAYAIPALVWLWWVGVMLVLAFAEKYGWFIEYHNRTKYQWATNVDEFGYNDFDKDHAIVWAHRVGTIFWGHWCREENRLTVTRWIGVGRQRGRNLTFYKQRDLR